MANYQAILYRLILLVSENSITWWNFIKEKRSLKSERFVFD